MMAVAVVMGYEVVEFGRDGVREVQELKIQHVRDLRQPRVFPALHFSLVYFVCESRRLHQLCMNRLPRVMESVEAEDSRCD